MRFRNIKKRQKQAVDASKPKYVYARYVDRVKAFITDMFMIYAPILYVTAYMIMDGKDDFQSSEIAPLLGVALYGVIYALLLSKFGHTPGKKAYEMKVVDDKSGEYIGFFKASFRFIAFLFTATTLLGLLLPFYRKDKKALHDLICGTIVVVEKK
ncbi:membrane protein containing RDD domain [Sulfurimonas gotlandica GD1]|uniref:Membrane protein containing RDD domain n=1 Tax=Sulfurimonas gotlandica (strain DSM 19862 / JCM 16533 / GD1) TaxID=929558 RepID=B6BHS1_SULGG|nr:RDD family protein [Sulfurimonas gotlandica]EDZ63605.1 RDD protein [Sulfurimonas gotlandica GD1]EHP30072.1 membrane protein containing RDD domain [Sulfurimonas gotlandica GD1]